MEMSKIKTQKRFYQPV